MAVTTVGTIDLDKLIRKIDQLLVTIENLLTSLDTKTDVDLSSRASESTATDISTKLEPPTALRSTSVPLDNSTGTTDLVQALFASSTPSKYATIYLPSSATTTVYIGDSTSQDFPLEPGGKIETSIADLSNIYVRVPAGASVTIYVLWEA